METVLWEKFDLKAYSLITISKSVYRMERIKRISELLDSWNNLFVQNQSAGIVSGDSSIARGYR